MKKLLTSIAACGILAGVQSCAPLYQDLVQRAEENALNDIAKSVVCIRNQALYTDGTKTYLIGPSYGTGFVISPHEVITNYHVSEFPKEISYIDWISRKRVTLTRQAQELAIVDNRFDSYVGDDVLLQPTDRLSLEDKLDTIVLHAEKELYASYSYQLWEGSLPINADIVVYGFPIAIDKYKTEGKVAKPESNVFDRSYIALDITVQPGNSGSPVFYKTKHGRMYLVGQIRSCIALDRRSCDGISFASHIDGLRKVWQLTPQHNRSLRKLEAEDFRRRKVVD